MASEDAAAANLKKFQCLFVWKRPKLGLYDRNLFITSLKDRVLTSDCGWRSIIYYLVAAFEYYEDDENEKALECLRECENIIQAAECFGVGSVVIRNIDSVKHVVHATWAHCIARVHTVDEYKDYLQDIITFKSMNNYQKAGVKGIQAACLMLYGEKGYEEAHGIIQTAIKLNPNEAEWHYLLAETLRFLRCQRPDQDSSPNTIEIAFLQKAHSLDPDSPAYQLSLALALHDSVRKEKGSNATREKATLLYRTAIHKWPTSAYVNVMAASGLLEYSYPVRDTKLADKCLGNALRLAPDSCYVHLVAGVFFLWPCNNSGAAMGHLNKAKLRFRSLVENIINGGITNYREALIRGLLHTGFETREIVFD